MQKKLKELKAVLHQLSSQVLVSICAAALIQYRALLSTVSLGRQAIHQVRTQSMSIQLLGIRKIIASILHL